MPDENGYPTEEELETIRQWNFSLRSMEEFLLYIHRCWWPPGPSSGFDLRGKNVKVLWLHTYGWSGNESIIEAMSEHPTFWLVCWRLSRRGGHYQFRINMKLFPNKNEVDNEQ